MCRQVEACRFFQTLITLSVLLLTGTPVVAQQNSEFRLLSESQPDLQRPEPFLQSGPAAAGRRVRILAADDQSGPAAVLYLPDNWNPEKRWPVLVELPGNGGFRNALGDVCTGMPEDCSLGYGLTDGRDWIWLSLPFLNADGSSIAATWWGDPPEYRPAATLRFWQQILQQVCSRYSGDSACVVLSGFSRGAIACNALGLHDDQISALWTAFLPCSHYDGIRRWPFPDSDPESAITRLQRLQDRPQFICGEGSQTESTRRWLMQHKPDLAGIEFHSTSFVNHSDRWVLHDVPARAAARVWLQQIRETRLKQ